MKRVLNFAVVAMAAVIMASSRADAAVVNVIEGSTNGYTMTDGNTYVIQNSVSFSNTTAGGSGMTVADGATVVIYVPAGVTLTATGANGSGRTGGGAGIRVPETATLVITGEGTVNATGGNAGNGGNGDNGENGEVTASGKYGKGFGGAGGVGGTGGGGAGCGIGGTGGYGGSGGAGATKVGKSQSCSASAFYIQCGNNGTAGNAGAKAESMGNVYCLGMGLLSCKSGLSGKKGDAGSSGSVATRDPSIYFFAACGGGGGGGGGAGASPLYEIGCGGRSGGGGGGGGGGPIDGDTYGKLKHAVFGGGGSGGGSVVSVGSSGAAANSAVCVEHTVSGGTGGAGGAAGAEGGEGTLYVSPTATVDVEREKLSATTHPAAQYTITFDANGGQFSSTIESLTATLGCELPDCIPTPTRVGYLFDGWRTAANEEYYGATGTKSISSYPVADDVVLYAQWSETVDHTVTTPTPVPYLYFESDYPALLAEHGGDYESAANATALNGRNKVWECYVAGISPTNASASFLATIEIGKDGSPEVKWTPDLNENGTKSVRTYTVEGKMELTGEWGPTNANSRFFRVKVELPK